MESSGVEFGDTDGIDDRFSEDENFVNNFMSIRNIILGNSGYIFMYNFVLIVDIFVS